MIKLTNNKSLNILKCINNLALPLSVIYLPSISMSGVIDVNNKNRNLSFRKMQVANPNNIKIYNLSAGKSLPEWLSDRKKRSLQRQDGELRRRIELMQVTHTTLLNDFITETICFGFSKVIAR